MRSKAFQLITLIFLIVITCVACGPVGDSNKVGQKLVEVTRDVLMVTVNGSGTVEITRERKLGFSTGGRIKSIYIGEGDRVSKGDLIASLDSSALELALAQQEAALVQARVARDEAEYDLKQLRDVLHASFDRVKLAEAALGAAEEQVRVAQQSVDEARKQLDEANITAPFDGVVVSVEADEGDYVAVTTTIIHLIDPATVELNIEVDELDIAKVNLGQKAVIDVDALPGEQLEGQVSHISPISKETAGVVVYEVKIAVDSPATYDLKAGMSASADIVVNMKENVLIVPNSAISQDEAGNFMVRIADDKQVEDRHIRIGISNGLVTEVLDGLEEGEKVINEK